MSSEYLPIVGIIAGLSVYIGVSVVVPDPVSAVVAGVLAAVCVLVWWYSPLPNRSVFAGPGGSMGSTEAGYWGFSPPKDGDGS